MTTKRIYSCNVCSGTIDIDGHTGVGFSFKSGGSEFEEGFPAQHENHLCHVCIVAICGLSNRISQLKDTEEIEEGGGG